MDKQHSMAALHTDANASAKGRRPINAKLMSESATVIPKIEYLTNSMSIYETKGCNEVHMRILLGVSSSFKK